MSYPINLIHQRTTALLNATSISVIHFQDINIIKLTAYHLHEINNCVVYLANLSINIVFSTFDIKV